MKFFSESGHALLTRLILSIYHHLYAWLPLFQNGIHNFWFFFLKTLFCNKDHFNQLSKESLKENNRLLDFKKILFYYVFISFCPYKRLLMPIYHYIYSYCSFMIDTRELYIEYEEG